MKELSQKDLEANMNEGGSFLDEMITQQEALTTDDLGNTPDETEGDPEETPIGERILSHEGRSAFLYLLKSGPVLASKKPNLFQAIERELGAIRRLLAEMFGVLVFDAKNGVAFVTDGTNEECLDDDEDHDDETPKSLFTRRQISLYDSLVLLVLRKHYQDREVAGDTRIEIDDEAIHIELVPLLQLSNSERSDERTLNGAVNKFLEKKILAKIHGKPRCYEITPLIRYVVSAAYLQKMKSEFGALLKETESDQAEESND